jgi:hypothetical protein
MIITGKQRAARQRNVKIAQAAKQKAAPKSLQRKVADWQMRDESPTGSMRRDMAKAVDKYGSTFGPGKSVTVYRGVDRRPSPYGKDLAHSWTTDLKMAKSYGRIVMSRRVTSKMPSIDVSKVLGSSEREIIIRKSHGRIVLDRTKKRRV